jgi:hypothetical protein
MCLSTREGKVNTADGLNTHKYRWELCGTERKKGEDLELKCGLGDQAPRYPLPPERDAKGGQVLKAYKEDRCVLSIKHYDVHSI